MENDSISAMIDKCTNMLTRTLGHLLSMGPPVVSVMSGRHPNRLLQYWFEDALIEDQFIPFGMVSADLVSGDEYVHRRGLIREAARASSSLPGAWPPIVDWIARVSRWWRREQPAERPGAATL